DRQGIADDGGLHRQRGAVKALRYSGKRCVEDGGIQCLHKKRHGCNPRQSGHAARFFVCHLFTCWWVGAASNAWHALRARCPSLSWMASTIAWCKSSFTTSFCVIEVK